MKIKTSELSGVALDWAVAKCLGLTPTIPPFAERPWLLMVDRHGQEHRCPSWTTDWSQGGPIIDRLVNKGMQIKPGPAGSSEVNVVVSLPWPNRFVFGSTVLEASMRYFVMSELGDEVEVPEELLA